MSTEGRFNPRSGANNGASRNYNNGRGAGNSRGGFRGRFSNDRPRFDRSGGDRGGDRSGRWGSSNNGNNFIYKNKKQHNN